MSYKNTPDAWKMDGLELSVEQKLNDVYDIASTAAAGALPSVSGADNGKALLVKSGKWQKSAIPSQLPTVSGTDNGNVLTVVEGAWAKAAPSGGLPAVTSDDNGDVLTVVEGSWAKAAPSGGSGVFEINFTCAYDEQTQSDVVTCDKTIQEIYLAYTAGSTIYPTVDWFGNFTVRPNEIDIYPPESRFAFSWVMVDSGEDELCYQSISWYSNEWSLYTFRYTLTPVT